RQRCDPAAPLRRLRSADGLRGGAVPQPGLARDHVRPGQRAQRHRHGDPARGHRHRRRRLPREVDDSARTRTRRLPAHRRRRTQWVIAEPTASSIRAEDGRAVTGDDISPFITNLPTGTDTRFFTTTNASGSTSQAANLVEALETGARTLLIDEDTSATNFMIRDDRM